MSRAEKAMYLELLNCGFIEWLKRITLFANSIFVFASIFTVSFWLAEPLPIEFQEVSGTWRGAVGSIIVTQRRFNVSKHGIKCKAVHYLISHDDIDDNGVLTGDLNFLPALDLPKADFGVYNVKIPILLPIDVEAGFYEYHSKLFCNLNPLRTVAIEVPVLDVEVFERNIVLPVKE